MTKAVVDQCLEIRDRLAQDASASDLKDAWRRVYEDVWRLSESSGGDIEDMALVTELGVSIHLRAREYGAAADLGRRLLGDSHARSTGWHDDVPRCRLAQVLFCDRHEGEAVAAWRVVLRETPRGHRSAAVRVVRATLLEALLLCPVSAGDDAPSQGIRHLVGEVLACFSRRQQVPSTASVTTHKALAHLLASTWPEGQADLPLFSLVVDRETLAPLRGER